MNTRDKLAGYRDQQYRPDMRLHILQILDDEPDKTVADRYLVRGLDRFGFRVDVAAVRNELQWLQDNAAAVKIVSENPVVATLAQAGLGHLERRRLLHGVSAPDLPEA